MSQAGVKVAHCIEDGEVFGIVLEDLFVFSDGVLQLALLDVFLRSTKNLRLIET